ncbi:hypothetical protein KMP13_12635 [Epibacterium ulvae]|uniref:hypothetical protein n=1 Tax=Epibacterium ulvae TaxID=1156985 RepID=UPI001BFCCF56|nr:hypothetical protein [Epibacterium ulvae]MBT8154716.1 hypothetical protein [Epibacterium ulvae]
MAPRRKQCIFCGSKEKMSAEHIWGKQIQKMYPHLDFKKHNLKSERTGLSADELIQTMQGGYAKKGHAFGHTYRCVCQICNSGWMSEIDDEAFKVFKKFKKEMCWVLGEKEQLALARYAFLKSHIIMAESHDKMGGFESVANFHGRRMNSFRETQILPAGFRVYLGVPPRLVGLDYARSALNPPSSWNYHPLYADKEIFFFNIMMLPFVALCITNAPEIDFVFRRQLALGQLGLLGPYERDLSSFMLRETERFFLEEEALIAMELFCSRSAVSLPVRRNHRRPSFPQDPG